ncbi:MAG: RRXRR domain-containing protein [Thermodesulfobacteriota bacterium]|nr:RRXRR domain-containing protein [Thermodesulfobacteriota bacterium]
MKVYVKSQSGKWLMPTHPAKARILLRVGKAKVINRMPFSIQLTYKTTEYVQPVTVGIDDGGVNIGIAAVSDGKTVYQQELVLRSDIKTKIDTKRQYRRSRRSRNKRYRKPRFLNRKQSLPTCKVCGGNAPSSKIICRKCLEKVKGVHQEYADIKQTVFRIPPSIKAKKDMIIRIIQNLPFPVSEIIIEDVYFDFQAMENPKITGEQYQQGPLLYHKNFKQACLIRDGFKCRKCGAEKQLQCHHKKPKSKKGTDKLSNLMTLCKQCHSDHHAGKITLPRSKKSFAASVAHVQQGKNYLQRKLNKIAPLSTTYGFITSHNRNNAGIEKTHANDAVIIADKHAQPANFQFNSRHVQSRKRNLHESIARKGRKQPNKTQKRNNKNVFTMKGFRRYDTVKYKGQVGFITGFSGTGTAYIIDIHGKYIKNPTKNYNMVGLSEIKWVSSNQTIITSPIHPLPN